METGICGWGMYVPRFRIKAEDIAHVWNQDPEAIKKGLGVREKTVAGPDEDTITISTEAAKRAIARASISPKEIGSLYIGSESHPYAVKPSGTVVAEAIGLGNEIFVADYEFACKAGTAAIQNCMGLVKSGMVKYGLAIGADTAQGRPGDALEYTAASGGAAFVIGQNPVAVIEHTYSFTSDTSDFWRREQANYPSHTGRFTGEPAYFRHVTEATKMLLNKTGLKPEDFSHAVFHMPNGKFPVAVSKKLGFTRQQIEKGLIVGEIGNTYSGSSLLGLSSVLDDSQPGQRILLVSYGSGAGSDAFSIKITDKITKAKPLAPSFKQCTSDKEYIDYSVYAKMRGKIKTD